MFLVYIFNFIPFNFDIPSVNLSGTNALYNILVQKTQIITQEEKIRKQRKGKLKDNS